MLAHASHPPTLPQQKFIGRLAEGTWVIVIVNCVLPNFNLKDMEGGARKRPRT